MFGQIESDPFQDHLLEIKQWQEQQVKKLRDLQHSQMIKLSEDRKRMDVLLKEYGGTKTVSNESEKENMTQLPNLASNPSDEVVEIPQNTVSHKNQLFDKQEEVVQKKVQHEVARNDIAPKQSQYLTKNQVSDPSSFKEAVNLQMAKLETDGKKRVTKKPFLRKGTGLLKFTIKKSTTVGQKPKSTIAHNQKKGHMHTENVISSIEQTPTQTSDDAPMNSPNLLECISKLTSQKHLLEKKLRKSPIDVVENDVKTVPEFQNDHTDCQQESVGFLQSQIKEKLQELSNEIAIYKDHNEMLAKLSAQREEEFIALKKERTEFNKSKETETRAVQKEVTEKRAALKREKASFERLQKIKQDTTVKAEKEEVASLKQQVVTLQEEAKRQSIKYLSESKHLRKLLSRAEQERDNLKAENKKLEVEHSNLSEALEKKQKHNIVISKTKRRISETVVKTTENEEVNSCDETTPSYDDDIPVHCRSSVKHHVRFNLEPLVQNFDPANDELNSYEMHLNSDKIEKIHRNGQKEIQHPNGTTEFISPDGLHKKYEFYNGDVKEIFPDKRVVYKFQDGSTETRFPDGFWIFEHADQQVEKFYPDGSRQVILPNGSNVLIYPDGSEEVHQIDGVVVKNFTDGMSTVTYPSGDKEFRTDDYIKHEFASGIVQTVYKSGRVETVYTDGHLNVSNKANE